MSSAAEILLKVKSEFNKNMFVETWITELYKLLFLNQNEEVNSELIDYAKKNSETEKNMKVIESLNTVIGEHNTNLQSIIQYNKNQFENFSLNHKNKVFKLLPQKDAFNKDFTYYKFFEAQLKSKFKDFDNQTTIFGTINQACKLYEEEDKITVLSSLLKKSSKISEIVFKKKSKEYIDRALFEDSVINYYNNEIKNLENYINISLDPELKCFCNETTLKLSFSILFNDADADRLLKLILMLNYKESLKKWFPYITKSKSKVVFTPSKQIYKVQSLIPIIQDRELYLYGFVENQLLVEGNNKITFYCRSADKNNEGTVENIFEKAFKTKYKERVQRIYANCIAFELTVLDGKKVNLNIFIDIEHKLKLINVQLVEIMSKQLCKQLRDKILDAWNAKELEKYFPQLPNELEIMFKNFYIDQINNFYELNKNKEKEKEKQKYNDKEISVNKNDSNTLINQNNNDINNNSTKENNDALNKNSSNEKNISNIDVNKNSVDPSLSELKNGFNANINTKYNTFRIDSMNDLISNENRIHLQDSKENDYLEVKDDLKSEKTIQFRKNKNKTIITLDI